MSDESEKSRQRIIQFCDDRKEFLTDVDGFVYWWPSPEPSGHLAAYHLRWIADELDRRNAKWQATIDEYMRYNR